MFGAEESSTVSREDLVSFGVEDEQPSNDADENANKSDEEDEIDTVQLSSMDKKRAKTFEDVLLESRVRAALMRIITKRKIKLSDATLERHGLLEAARQHYQLERTNSVPGKKEQLEPDTTPVRTHDHFLFKGEDHPAMQVRRMSMANMQVKVEEETEELETPNVSPARASKKLLPSPAASKDDGEHSVAHSSNSVWDFVEATDRAKYSLMVEKDREVYLDKLKSLATTSKQLRGRQRKKSEYWGKMMDFMQRDEPAIPTPYRPAYPTRHKPKTAEEEAEEGRFKMAPLQRYFAGIKKKAAGAGAIKSQEPSVPTPELLDWRTDLSFLK